MLETINAWLTKIDNFVWGVPLMVLIIAGGILLTVRLGLLQMRRLPLALKWMVKNEEEGEGEVTSFGVGNDWYRKYCRCCNRSMCRRTGSIILDDCSCIFWYGY